MRTYQKTDQEKEEMLEAANRERRDTGFRKMEERDAGGHYVTPEVLMEWHVPKDRRPDGVAYSNVPDGSFKLTINGQSAIIDAEEFRKSLRWV